MKFSLNDKVIVYDVDGIIATVKELTNADLMIVEYLNGKTKWVHPKQCRRLVKKPKKSSRDFIIEGMKYAIDFVGLQKYDLDCCIDRYDEEKKDK